MKKKPVRTCAICRKKQNKSDMIRIVNHSEEGVVLDASGKMNGRGTYVCAETGCIDAPHAKKQLASALKTEITSDVFDVLKKRTKDHIAYLQRMKSIQESM